MDYVERGLQDTAAQEIWRKIVSAIPIAARYRSEIAMESRAEGRAEGLAQGLAGGTTRSVLRILDRRGITLSPEARARITDCTDLELAETWLDEALTVASADELTGLAEG
jgi:hypothetical protein